MMRWTHQHTLQTEHSADTAIQAALVLVNIVTDAGKHLSLHGLVAVLATTLIL